MGGASLGAHTALYDDPDAGSRPCKNTRLLSSFFSGHVILAHKIAAKGGKGDDEEAQLTRPFVVGLEGSSSMRAKPGACDRTGIHTRASARFNQCHIYTERARSLLIGSCARDRGGTGLDPSSSKIAVV